MTRRERKQLLRTASDIFRMVPLAVSLVGIELFFVIPDVLPKSNKEAVNDNYSSRRSATPPSPS